MLFQYVPHAMFIIAMVFSFSKTFSSPKFAGGFFLVPALAIAIFGLGWWDIDVSNAASYHLPPISGLLALYFVANGFPVMLSVSNAYASYYLADFMAMLDFASSEGIEWREAMFGIGNAMDVPDALYVMTFFSLFGCVLISRRSKSPRFRKVSDRVT